MHMQPVLHVSLTSVRARFLNMLSSGRSNIIASLLRVRNTHVRMSVTCWLYGSRQPNHHSRMRSCVFHQLSNKPCSKVRCTHHLTDYTGDYKSDKHARSLVSTTQAGTMQTGMRVSRKVCFAVCWLGQLNNAQVCCIHAKWCHVTL